MSIFDDVADGILSFDSDYVTETGGYITALDENVITNKSMFLPQGSPVGKNNVAFLYTRNIDESISVINNKKNLVSNNKYKTYFFNSQYIGKIYNKKFRCLMRTERKDIYKKITDETGLSCIRDLSIANSTKKNMYFDMSKYIEILTSMCFKLNPKKYVHEYWSFMNLIFQNNSLDGFDEFVVVDLSKTQKLTKKLKENLENPLFMIYYSLYIKSDDLKLVNIPFYFYNDKKILKITPSNLTENDLVKLKANMSKILLGITKKEIITVATDDEQIEKDEIISDTTTKITKLIDDERDIIYTDKEIQKLRMTTPIEKNVEDKVVRNVDNIKKETIQASNTVNGEEKSKEIIDNAVTNKVKKEIDADHDLLLKMYYAKKPKIKSSASTARDMKLREEQEHLEIDGMTFEKLSKINAFNETIPETDISNVIDTSNKNMATIRFSNLDKKYNTEIIKKDIMSAFTSLNNKSLPLFIRKITVSDTSDELNYKDTYSVYFEDGNRQRHTVKVDIPKFIDDKFLYIGGNKKVIKHQSFFLPVVKVASNKVEIVTNYSKMTIERVDRNINNVGRMKKVIKTNEELRKCFKVGSSNNTEFITTLEYDQYARAYTHFEYGKTFIMFDQHEALNVAKQRKIRIPENHIFIGTDDSGKNIFINLSTGLSQDNATITNIIFNAVPEEIKDEYMRTKGSARLSYAKVKIMKQNMNVGLLLGLWIGLSELMKRLNMDYRLVNKMSEVQLNHDEEYIKFNDCIMIYKQNISSALIMNGIKLFNTSDYSITSFDTKEPYIDYISKVYGKAIIENALTNFYEFVLDPITVEVLEYLNLPTNIIDLYIHAVNLLSDNQFKNSINQNLYRIRCGEIIPAILYERIAKNYVNYRNSNGRVKFSVPQNAVIKEVLAQKTVEDYSTLNPMLEMNMLSALSTKGFRGINLDDSYTIEKRAYDNSMIGIVAPNTSPDGSVGISRTLTMEPNVKNVRGIVGDNQGEYENFNDTNLFSLSELTIPMSATIDDPNRLGHSVKQSSHVIPVKDSSPVLISNGVDQRARFHLSKSFVINAEESGTIVDYDPKANIMMAQYKSGKYQAIDLKPNIVKNGGGGFFLSNELITDLKVGDKFNKNDILAYHKDFFTNNKFNKCRLNIGTLTKVAIMSTYNTYEDATFITKKLSEKCASDMVFCKSVVVGKNSNVFNIVKKGDSIEIGDPLIQFDTSYDDESINSLLSALADADKENILEGSRNEVKSKYSGVIEDIKIYSTIELEEMSPSLRSIVSSYYKEINKRKSFLDKYDKENNIVKCGILMNETSKKVEPNQFGVIKGENVVDSVLIEFYIKHTEPLEVGSKIANFTALKNTIGEIIPEGYEPFSESRPDEEISTIIASNSILNRMTPSILVTALGNKCIIELKRHLEELGMDRKKMENMIYKFFSAIDKTGENTKKYKSIFSNMTDTKFNSYFKEFFKDDSAYLILDVVDYERMIKLEDIEDAAKVLGIELFEYVYLPHITMDKSKIICTKEPVPVGYINEKRTQQTVMKKNGISTDISERSAITNQVTGKDKNGRESDLENTMLISMGLTNTLKELNGPRADDGVMKQQMLNDIALNGFTRLADMDDDVTNKTTLNTVDAYYRCMGIQTDLVVKGLMLPKTLDDEL